MKVVGVTCLAELVEVGVGAVREEYFAFVEELKVRREGIVTLVGMWWKLTSLKLSL